MPNKNKLKVKDFVGRSINAYQKEAVKQINDIKKKNIEQNHKISILSKEFGKEYITKTSDTSVVSLDSSKEGLVYIDALEGNTMVNYCTDGEKELILNGDIDIEGVNLTTNNGVDNGLVDVMCEGNTLVNLVKSVVFTTAGNGGAFDKTKIENGMRYVKNKIDAGVYPRVDLDTMAYLLKPSTTYTVIFKANTNDELRGMNFSKGADAYVGYSINYKNVNKLFPTGVHAETFTTPTSDLMTDKFKLGFNLWGVNKEGKYVELSDFMVLEGDYTNKEIPPYFTGMKSVGELDNGTGSIDVLTQNQNKLDGASLSSSNGWVIFSGTITNDGYNGNKALQCSNTSSTGYKDVLCQHLWHPASKTKKVKENTWYTFSFYAKCNSTSILSTYIYPTLIHTGEIGYVNGVAEKFKSDGHIQWNLTKEWKYCTMSFKTVGNVTNSVHFFQSLLFRLFPGNEAIISCPMLIEGENKVLNFKEKQTNTKQILLNEPLRGLPNGVKDRFVKIGGKWFIERNCKEKLITQNESWNTSASFNGTDVSFFYFVISDSINKANTINLLSDKFISSYTDNRVNIKNSNLERIYIGDNLNGLFQIHIANSKLSGTSINSLKTWLSNNPFTIVYQLETPTYEPLQINPELKCYNDITHISNNSIIPCNMKVKNTGYNAVIKPNTKYTVVCDTNKNIALGINLGGGKSNTANTITTVNTPATLVDDNLRMHGEGIISKNIRVLEGDYLNNTPSMFNGLLSSFENKNNLAELKIVNENLISNEYNKKKYVISNRAGVGRIHSVPIQNLPKGFTGEVWISCNIKSSSLSSDFKFYYIDTSGKSVYPGTISSKTETGIIIKKFQFPKQYPYNKGISIYIDSNADGEIEVSDMMFSIKQITNHTQHLSNQINLQLKAPLRGIGDVRDRLVIKDNKVMIERNCKELILNNDAVRSYTIYSLEYNGTMCPFSMKLKNDDCLKGGYIPVPCNKLAAGKGSYKGSTFPSIQQYSDASASFVGSLNITQLSSATHSGVMEYFNKNSISVSYILDTPIYEEVPTELSKLILECYNNSTLFIDTIIPPKTVVRYSGEAPIVTAVKSNTAPIELNTTDINDFILPYMLDMDYRLLCLQMNNQDKPQISKLKIGKLCGSTYEMLKKDILSKRYSTIEYTNRIDLYNKAKKLSEEEYIDLCNLIKGVNNE